MALGPSTYLVDSWLKVFAVSGYTFSVSSCYVQLHVGDPGPSGTANKALELTRKVIPWDQNLTSSYDECATKYNSVDITWTSIIGSEDATHFSLWDSLTDGTGNFLGSGAISAVPYTAGSNFTIPKRHLSVSLGLSRTKPLYTQSASFGFGNPYLLGRFLDTLSGYQIAASTMGFLFGRLHTGDPGPRGLDNRLSTDGSLHRGDWMRFTSPIGGSMELLQDFAWFGRYPWDGTQIPTHLSLWSGGPGDSDTAVDMVASGLIGPWLTKNTNPPEGVKFLTFYDPDYYHYLSPFWLPARSVSISIPVAS